MSGVPYLTIRETQKCAYLDVDICTIIGIKFWKFLLLVKTANKLFPVAITSDISRFISAGANFNKHWTTRAVS